MYDVKKLFRAGSKGCAFRQATLRKASLRAFTIVEVMIATGVMALAISSSLIVLQHGLRVIDNARYTTLAGQILQSQMEKLRLLSWSQLIDPSANGPMHPDNATFSPDISASATTQINRFTVGTATGVCAQSITAAEAPYDVTMKKITLTATWSGLDGRRHSLSYITYYGQYGISDFFYTTH
jgi:type II secretory pathway pseudopilin PulG